MDEKNLKTLIDLAQGARAADEAIAATDMSAVPARGATCLSFARLAVLASGEAALSPAEWRHVAGCRLCAMRMGRTVSRPSRPAHAWRRVGLVAAAASLALFVGLLLRNGPGTGGGTNPVADNGRVQFLIELPLPNDVLRGEPGSAVQTASLRPEVDQRSALMALVRTWDRACGCLVWRLHQWSDGSFSTCAGPGDAPEIAVSFADAAPVDGVVVVAMSGTPDDLPDSAEEANALVDCLNSGPASSADLYACADAVQSCLPDGVKVVPHRLARAGR